MLALFCLAATLAGVGAATPDRAGARCLKLWHEKKVTKYVKGENGKVKKVTQIKRYRTCDPYEARGPSRLGVAATEFKFTLSRPRLTAGKLLLEYTNRGEDVHNLKVAAARGDRVLGAVPDTEAGDVTDAEFRLQPGHYRLWCSLPGHAKLGMKARLLVLR